MALVRTNGIKKILKGLGKAAWKAARMAGRKGRKRERAKILGSATMAAIGCAAGQLAARAAISWLERRKMERGRTLAAVDGMDGDGGFFDEGLEEDIGGYLDEGWDEDGYAHDAHGAAPMEPHIIQAPPYVEGDAVFHPFYGRGKVVGMRISLADDDYMVSVDFASCGLRKMCATGSGLELAPLPGGMGSGIAAPAAPKDAVSRDGAAAEEGRAGAPQEGAGAKGPASMKPKAAKRAGKG